MTDSSPKQAMSLLEAVALAEASAFRITPKFVYAYKHKDGNKSLGLVPVHIKHANVFKYIDDLVDPEPGTPLANTVIGEIPKHYKAATDLILKDPNKTLKDVLTKEGQSSAAEPLHDLQPASAPVPQPSPGPAAPVPPQAITKADVQAALGGTASVPLDAYLHAVQFGQDPTTDLKLLKNPQVTSVLLKVYGANWKAQAAALGFAVPGLNPVAPEVANAAKILNFAPGSMEFKALESLHKHGNDVDATVALAGGDDASEDDFAKAAKTVNKAIASAKKAGLVNVTSDEDDDDIDVVKFKPMAASPMLTPAPAPAPAPAAPVPLPTPAPVAAISLPTPPATSPAPPGFVTFNLADLNNGQEGVTIQNPKGFTFEKIGGKWWLDGIHAADTSALVGQAFRVVVILKGPKTPRAAPPAPTTTTPTATQTAPVTSGGLGLPAIPPLTTLSLVGDAKASLGGAHPKQFVKDAAGNTFLFKTGADAPALAAAAYANIAAKVFGAEGAIPVAVGTVSGVGSGSVQPMIPNIKTDLSKVDLTTLTPDQLARLMKERVLDWALASHDAKAANFMLTNDGNVVGIDKDQALKFIGKDSLDTTYKPNPSPLIYGALFDLFKKKKVDLPVSAMLPAIEKIEDISDDAWLANLGPYLGAKGGSPKELTVLKDEILKRKKNVRKDLEAFLTGVFQERGDIGMTDTFEFEAGKVSLATKAGKKKKKDLGGISVPPMGSILSPPQLPSISSLVPEGAASGIGGAGEKFFFAGPDGKYLVKLARSKNKAKIEPFRIAAQEMFSQVSSVVRPGKSIPVGNVPEGYKGIPASIQPWMAGATPLGAAGTNPSLLTDSERKDVAEEHALDWLMSQHDTHAANFVRRPDGALLSVDKEQGFKFMLPGTAESADGDKLAIDYHPNKVENEPYYNKFWKAFADGSMSFDPKEMTGAIERIEAISDSDYTQLLSKFASEAKFKDDPKKVAEFLDLALARKQNIRKDFESFIGGLYAKRTKKKGTFTFAGGWDDGTGVTAPAAPPAAPVSGVQPQLEVDVTKTGKLGASGVDLYSPANAQAPVAPVAPPNPWGYSDPPKGKMWSVKSGSTFFSTGPDGNFYKTKPPKGPDGAPDGASENVIVKLKNLTLSEAEESLKQLGLTPLSLKVKGEFVIAMMPKTELAKGQASGKNISVLVDLPPAAPPPSGKGTVVPKPGVLKNVVLDEQKETVALIKNIEKAKLSLGKVMIADGNMVEHNSMMVQRHKDAKGKTFYRVSFKLREAAQNKMTGGTASEFDYPKMSYDPATDTWVESGGKLSGGTFETRKWTSGDSQLSMGTGENGQRTFLGMVVADVYPKAGQSVEDALEGLLITANPAVGKAVMTPPSKDDLDVMKLSSMLWAVAPQLSNSLPEKGRTSENLRAILKKNGYTDAELNSIRLEKVGFNGRVVPVLPGRSKKILAANPKMKYVRHGFGSVDKVVKHLLSGSIAVGDRLQLGIPTSGTTSGSADINTGGADYLFTKPGLEDNKDFAWGEIQMVVDPSELDRLDVFTHSGDNYGKTSGTPFDNRQPLESSSTQGKTEMMFRHGFSPNKVIKIRTQSATARNQVIAGLKAAGVTDFNGMPVEDLVVHSDDFYTDHLKPAGY
jgi:hypothetical protein